MKGYSGFIFVDCDMLTVRCIMCQVEYHYNYWPWLLLVTFISIWELAWELMFGMWTLVWSMIILKKSKYMIYMIIPYIWWKSLHSGVYQRNVQILQKHRSAGFWIMRLAIISTNPLELTFIYIYIYQIS